MSASISSEKIRPPCGTAVYRCVCVLALAFFSATGLGARELGIEQWTTSTGARVLFQSAPEIPMVDVAIDIDAGSRWDPPDQAGLASMTLSMLSKGIRAHGAMPALGEQATSEAFAELAASRGGSVTLDRTSLTVRFLSDAEVRDATVALMARLLAHPVFDADILDREKKRTIASIEESLTQPQYLATKALWKSVYGTHPYGAEASVESVARITSLSLRDFHGRRWQTHRMRITIVGALSSAQAKEISEKLLALMPKSDAPAYRIASSSPAPIPPAKPTRQAIAHPATQSHLWLGMTAIARDDPDFFALTVANYIFGGGGFVSRLTEEVREKRGLSYSVFSAFQPLAQPGPFMIGLQTQKAKAPEALDVVKDTLLAYLKKGPTEKELKAAKQNLIGGFALRVDTNRKLLDNLAQINFYDMPLDYLQTWTDKIAAVTLSDVRRVMNRVVDIDKLSVVVVAGPENFQP